MLTQDVKASSESDSEGLGGNQKGSCDPRSLTTQLN